MLPISEAVAKLFTSPNSSMKYLISLKKLIATKSRSQFQGTVQDYPAQGFLWAGILISTEKLNRIIEINEEQKYIITEPGVILDMLQKEVNQMKLLYPPDPTEWNCFIGGTIATNASGEKTFKYGSTRNFVEELQIVLASGETIDLKRGRDKASGYHLKLITRSGKELADGNSCYKYACSKKCRWILP